ncbi:bacterial regulatory s, deor family protein [Lacticaseibacillus sharpeae JCM 1186 = DSM 20505]|uniref:Lactose phosphotransferase system repressor n=1 Tax=Lacticaseibacillus sharpeae JCM 1186 = DSM 20505 TaxID=1291052 RepID=A0A0R1ZI08_9LACO|nr:bacterial regulatory s, deor family protein [Lacticaseibacillus sharpeae JCM 1186 = DSM 20505]
MNILEQKRTTSEVMQIVLKRQRLLTIRNLVDRKGIVTVNEIGAELNVSTMTVRRDLAELAENHAVIRVHGGAQSPKLAQKQDQELSRLEKRDLRVEEKRQIASQAAQLIEAGDTIFIGPGTTNEFIADYLTLPELRVVTNSLPVFDSFKSKADRYELCLVGGTYRERSGAFIGNLANEMLEHLRTTKAFVSANGVCDSIVSNANADEGQIQRLALNNSRKRYILADHTKLDTEDFYGFYSLDDVDGLITDKGIDEDQRNDYQKLTRIITNE